MHILILHGWGLTGDRYEPLVKLLSQKGHMVLAPDMPGFGKHALLEKPLDLDDYVDFVAGYIKEHNFNKPIIIAHSFGGRVAIRLSRKHPKMVSKLILTGVPGYRTDSSLKIKLFKFIAQAGKPVAGMLFRGGVLELVTKSLYVLAGNFDYYRANPVLKKTFQNVISDSLVSDMKQIIIETHLIWGQNDTITPVWIGEKMKETIKNARLTIVSDTNHRLPYQHPKEFLDAIGTL